MPKNPLPISNALLQLALAFREASEEHIEQAIWSIDKPLQKITLHDVREALDKLKAAP